MVDVNVPAIEKLIDYGASGIGAIAGALLAPWKASREGKARLIAAETDAQVRQIQAQTDASALNIIAEAQSKAQAYLLPADADIRAKLDITREDIAQSFEFQGRKRLSNARAVLEGAADELGDKEVPDHDPDPDWTARFFDCVQDVSAQDMQRIWARILAGEVENPGQTSLRTLDTLRNMTKRDAEMFRDICDFVFNHKFAFYDKSVSEFAPLALGNLLYLEDCGLINVEQNLLNRFVWDRDCRDWQIALFIGTSTLLITSNQEPREALSIPIIGLTASGSEISKLVQCTFQMEYLQALAKFLQSKDCRLEYLVGVEPLYDERITYSRRVLIEPAPMTSEAAE